VKLKLLSASLVEACIASFVLVATIALVDEEAH
jgi:hypothetical protein